MTIFRTATAAPADGDDNERRKSSAYERKKAREAQKQRSASAAARELSPIPPPADPDRRAQALDDFRLFCETYFAARFALEWSPDHLTVLADFQRVIIDGGLCAVAMPRGSGKTSLAECAVLWAALRGSHQFVVLIGATEAAARDILVNLKAELEENEALAADFPEVCVPIRALEKIAQRRLLYEGRPVTIKITKTAITLPDLPPSPASGAVLRVAGLTGRIRGMAHKRPDGTKARPRLVIIDDPQTDKSAKSPGQNATREKLLAGAVLGLAGPGQKMSAIMPCTVIEPNDMAERILDRQKHPEWGGRRTKLLYEWPEDMELWSRYQEVRAEGLREDDGGAAGNAFYKANREAMDRGARAAWPARHGPDELSAVQNAMNLFYADAVAFHAEYQNDPEAARPADDAELRPADIINRHSGRKRGEIPQPAEMLAAGIDVQGGLLYWTVIAAEPDTTAYVIDYGTWPDQKRQYFTLRDAQRTIAKAFPKAEPDAQLYGAIDALIRQLAGREWKREDGTPLPLARLLIDGRWRDEVVFRACAASPHKTILLPAFGTAKRSRAGQREERRPRPGEIVKHDLRVPPVAPGRPIRHANIDSDAWISRVVNALRLPIGSRGALSLWTDRPAVHECYADHLTAEYAQTLTSAGKTWRVWTLKPGGPDNHWLDSTKLALAGCYLAGAEPAWSDQPKPSKTGGKKKPRWKAL